MLVWYNGCASSFQVDDKSSILFTRSKIMKILDKLDLLLKQELAKPYVDLTLTCRIDNAINDVRFCLNDARYDVDSVLEEFHPRVYDLLKRL